jgi:hypothetical protein
LPLTTDTPVPPDIPTVEPPEYALFLPLILK